MPLQELQPGQSLGERFTIIGLLGTGGVANVYLAVDGRDGEQVALKVVHPRWSGDPAVRKRIQREMAAASLLQSDAILVPRELHTLDGLLCLSMPYHTGQTLAERVAAQGPLPIDEVRSLGIRLAGALEEAHRAGLLHRDVSANNVMLHRGEDAQLLDFGLARPQAAPQSTALLGTTGYAAPELFAGARPDIRSDLYGLGCVLHLALTGELPHEARTTSVRSLRTDCPPALADVVDALLREREARPSSATEVRLALERDHGPPSKSHHAASRYHLRPGNWMVVVWEREDDRSRRDVLRVENGKSRSTFNTFLTGQIMQLWRGVLALIGAEDPQRPTPEQLLVWAVADEAHIERDLLGASPAILNPRFTLIEGIERHAARRIAADARSAGFRAKVVHHGRGFIDPGRLAKLIGSLLLAFLIPMPGLFVLAWVVVRLIQEYREVQELPVAYGASLNPWLARPVPGLPQYDDSEEPSGAPPPSMLERVHHHLDALRHTAETVELPRAARDDILRSVRELRTRADTVAAQLVPLERELDAPVEDLSWVRPRLERLRTKMRAGEEVDAAALEELQRLAERDQHLRELQARLEVRITALTARLLEIGATAAAVRRSLLAGTERPEGVTRALDELRREARAAWQTRVELTEGPGIP